ncbi:MAG: C_GCAxxG_C_C family protein [Bacteroidales bacterium]|nr:C_GCAxxG_C_C family protein [Bacteroidales bacterium]
MENFIENKVAQAVQYFKSGYNCSQSVFMAFAEDFGVDTAFASKISASYGGGIGRMREVCGAVCGMAMCASFIAPADNPSDKSARTANYALVQEFAEKFRAENGDIICRRLLGLPDENCPCPEPSTRNAEFYKKRPCVEYVAYAARLVAEKMMEKGL